MILVHTHTHTRVLCNMWAEIKEMRSTLYCVARLFVCMCSRCTRVLFFMSTRLKARVTHDFINFFGHSSFLLIALRDRKQGKEMGKTHEQGAGTWTAPPALHGSIWMWLTTPPLSHPGTHAFKIYTLTLYNHTLAQFCWGHATYSSSWHTLILLGWFCLQNCLKYSWHWFNAVL